MVCNGITTTLGYNDANQWLTEAYSGGTLTGFIVTNAYATGETRTVYEERIASLAADGLHVIGFFVSAFKLFASGFSERRRITDRLGIAACLFNQHFGWRRRCPNEFALRTEPARMRRD